MEPSYLAQQGPTRVHFHDWYDSEKLNINLAPTVSVEQGISRSG
jgi:hypothetical protein